MLQWGGVARAQDTGVAAPPRDMWCVPLFSHVYAAAQHGKGQRIAQLVAAGGDVDKDDGFLIVIARPDGHVANACVCWRLRSIEFRLHSAILSTFIGEASTINSM